MTTGNILFGTGACDAGPQYTRVWSGTDGRRNTDGTTRWNPYTSATTRTKKSSGTRTPSGCGTNCTKVGCWVACGFPTVPWSGNDDLRLYSKLGEEIKAHKFNAGVFLGQSHQLVGQALSTSTALYRALLCLDKGRLDCALTNLGLSPGQRSRKRMKARLNQGDISGTWLAMQYGWLPSLSDIFAAAEAFEALTKPPREQVYRSRVTNSIEDESSGSSSNYSCARAAIRKKVLHYRLTEYLPVSRSLGLLDPLSVAWELMPWSFVIDWFIPIGTYVESLAVTPYLRGSWMLQDVVESVSQGPTKLLGCQYTNCTGGKESNSKKVVVRTTGTSPLSVPYPEFDLGRVYSGKRLLNALALFHQQLLLPRKYRSRTNWYNV